MAIFGGEGVIGISNSSIYGFLYIKSQIQGTYISDLMHLLVKCCLKALLKIVKLMLVLGQVRLVKC